MTEMAPLVVRSRNFLTEYAPPKRFFRLKSRIKFPSANETKQPMYVDSERVEICGIVVGVIRGKFGVNGDHHRTAERRFMNLLKRLLFVRLIS